MSKTVSRQQLLDAHMSDAANAAEKLGKVIIRETTRENGSVRIQQDFSNCPTMTEQHSAHLSDINYLIEKYQPDELNAYIQARNQYRQEILGHDFSKEPSLQDAQNIVYQSKQEFEKLPDSTKLQFKNHLEFLKFIDNPANAKKMLELGILTKRQLDGIQIPQESPIKKTETATAPSTTRTTTQEKDEEKK